eukprot:757768-Hanusia_phi.AAC.7
MESSEYEGLMRKRESERFVREFRPESCRGDGEVGGDAVDDRKRLTGGRARRRPSFRYSAAHCEWSFISLPGSRSISPSDLRTSLPAAGADIEQEEFERGLLMTWDIHEAVGAAYHIGKKSKQRERRGSSGNGVRDEEGGGKRREHDLLVCCGEPDRCTAVVNRLSACYNIFPQQRTASL